MTLEEGKGRQKDMSGAWTHRRGKVVAGYFGLRAQFPRLLGPGHEKPPYVNTVGTGEPARYVNRKMW